MTPTAADARRISDTPPPPLEAGDEEDEDGDGMSDEDKDDVRVVALHGFNSRHRRVSTSARRGLSALELSKNRSWGHLGREFEGNLSEVFRTRLYLAEKYDPFVTTPLKAPRRRRKHKRWSLDDSTIWAPRKLRGNSRDYYETEEALGVLFATDWELASRGVARMIERGSTPPSPRVEATLPSAPHRTPALTAHA